MSVSQHRRKDAPTARQRWSTLAVTALGLLLAQPAAYAAGFGQLRVQSNLGQPLQAEIDISGVSAEEAAGLSVKLAPPAAYAAAGLTYLPAIGSLRLEVERRPNGSYVARVRSAQPISEPFVDLLVDMSWASGKVSRAYTFLLDPAGARPSNQTFSPATVVPAATPDAPPAAAAPQPAQQAAPAATAEVARPAALARPARRSAQRAPAPAASGGADMAPGGGYTVQRGDTLSGIAGEAVQGQESVSLDQMLVALYRNNPNAFIGGNINRLRSGAVLQVPTQQQVQAVTPKAARREVVARTQGFDAYRSRLASAAAAKSVEPDSGRQQSGNVTARVQEQAAPADGPRDELKLSKAARGAQADAAAKAEAGVARERELKEAQARLAQLEKNVGDMQKLLELKNVEIAKLSQANQAALADKEKADAAAKAAAAAPTVVAAQPPKADAVAPAAAAATAAATVVAAASAPAAATAGASAADAAAPAAASAVAAAPASQPAAAVAAKAAQDAAAASAPAVKRTPPVVAQPAPVPEPSFVDGLLANPMLLPGGGLLVALLGVYAIYRRRQQQKTSDTTGFGDSVLSQESTVMAGANSLFGTAGGQSVDTSQHSVFGADFRIGNNTPEANEVDPIAEAEVYIAYGRDVQAEEILREALEKNPEQQPVRLKLLEIYSNRQDVEGFRVIAEEMFAQTGGHGAEWLKAAEMGRALEPGNALFLAVTPEAAGPETASPATDQWRTQDPSHNPASIPTLEPSLGDLALPLDAFPAPAAGDPIVAPASAAMVFGAEAQDAGEAVRLDLGLPESGVDPLADDVPRLDTPTRGRPLEFDMSGLSLDLGSAPLDDARSKAALDEATAPLPATTLLHDGKLAEPIDLSRVAPDTGGYLTQGGAPSTLSADGMDGGRDMQIKLDLARAYIEIGDKEGARELLQEVVEQSQDPLQAEARSLLQEVA
ncbi:FimV/HubP family polar landmark protein [Cupriavidus sp. TMH.W2]|uniref:FimV/HubP family polar landmark protein n=1 Tax=Cupriavidus sp. TMH.W2 TaxID=3434465 RepID=UPI003D778FCF